MRKLALAIAALAAVSFAALPIAANAETVVIKKGHHHHWHHHHHHKVVIIKKDHHD